MDAITLLKKDHKTVEALFKQFEKAEDQPEKARQIADEIVEQLSVHAAIEELVFYPAVRDAVDDTEETVLESLEEHHVVKLLLSELETMDPTHERFKPKMTVLIENVRHHVEEEEQELFPQVREVLKRKALGEIGEALEEAKKTAPVRPHPKAPDTPPANVVASGGAALIDRVRKAARGAVSR